ncbi:hypothetical protein PAXRUDRAFT_832225 [Paxillus rubicundulus Ve08.2h10]|uniref:Uncharacterized protein n=1 Tax=Paxillus rubicundulus Ve08.2h10 TaxID=930991 RepID=A0A0D0DRM4_9AGAM|nr:hypothetical protein PAXRUDRAFT_832225 [Paxillus rubicundulus Ve08.2h10]
MFMRKESRGLVRAKISYQKRGQETGREGKGKEITQRRFRRAQGTILHAIGAHRIASHRLSLKK